MCKIFLPYAVQTLTKHKMKWKSLAYAEPALTICYRMQSFRKQHTSIRQQFFTPSAQCTPGGYKEMSSIANEQ
jgi:hypothetical protein